MTEEDRTMIREYSTEQALSAIWQEAAKTEDSDSFQEFWKSETGKPVSRINEKDILAVLEKRADLRESIRNSNPLLLLDIASFSEF